MENKLTAMKVKKAAVGIWQRDYETLGETSPQSG